MQEIIIKKEKEQIESFRKFQSKEESILFWFGIWEQMGVRHNKNRNVCNIGLA